MDNYKSDQRGHLHRELQRAMVEDNTKVKKLEYRFARILDALYADLNGDINWNMISKLKLHCVNGQVEGTLCDLLGLTSVQVDDHLRQCDKQTPRHRTEEKPLAGSLKKGSYTIIYEREPEQQYTGDCETDSKALYKLIDVLGYALEHRNYRKAAFNATDMFDTNDEYECISTGSKTEGAACRLESDFDVMNVLTNIICIEKGVKCSSKTKTVLSVDTSPKYYGYCKLAREQLDQNCPKSILDCLVPDGTGKEILNSNLFADSMIGKANIPGGVVQPRAGPACPVSNGIVSYDYVYALRCHCPSFLDQWAKRHREWPASDIVQKVTSMEGYVVPVGFKESETKQLEWRICFTTAETELMRNLNGTQFKVYVLLKDIVKHVLIPRNKEVTSYMVKNLVFWMAENNPPKGFHEGRLLHWLREGLGQLKQAISTSTLLSYFIPERNLMILSKFDNEQKRKWEATITDMMDEGPRIILRLNKLTIALKCYPEPLLWYCTMKTELEMLELEYWVRSRKVNAKHLSAQFDLLLQHIIRRKENILLKVCERLHIEGSDESDLKTVENRLFQ